MEKNILIKFDDGTEEIVKLGIVSDEEVDEIVGDICDRLSIVKYPYLCVKMGSLVIENIILNADKIKLIKIIEGSYNETN